MAKTPMTEINGTRRRRWTIAAFPVVGLVVHGVGYLASGRWIGAAS